MGSGYYKRKLPHIMEEGATYFVTFRLADSLPRRLIAEVQDDYESKISANNDYGMWQDFFEKYEGILDRVNEGHRWLSDRRIAKIVAEAIHYRDKSEYDVIAFSIMPNHVH